MSNDLNDGAVVTFTKAHVVYHLTSLSISQAQVNVTIAKQTGKQASSS